MAPLVIDKGNTPEGPSSEAGINMDPRVEHLREIRRAGRWVVSYAPEDGMEHLTINKPDSADAGILPFNIRFHGMDLVQDQVEGLPERIRLVSVSADNTLFAARMQHTLHGRLQVGLLFVKIEADKRKVWLWSEDGPSGPDRLRMFTKVNVPRIDPAARERFSRQFDARQFDTIPITYGTLGAGRALSGSSAA